MNIVGRIVARGEVVGLYLPMGKSDRLDGIYNVVEVLGELQIQRVGDPAMPRGQFTGLGLEDLMVSRPASCMTEAEYDSVRQKAET